MTDLVNSKLAHYGAWTYRGAWALEITAALIGLATGLMLGFQAFSASESTSMELVLASAPFFMVALAELTKIPLATLLFSVAWWWKPLVLLVLIALAGITFETVFMGLERAATLRQLQYEELTKSIAALIVEQDGLRTVSDEAKATDFMQLAQKEYEQVTQMATSERASLQDQIAAVDQELESHRALSPEATRAQAALAAAKQERSALVAEQAAALQEAVRQFESQRDSYVERLPLLSNDPAAAAQIKAALAALVNPRIRLQAENQAALAMKDAEIAAFQLQFDGLAVQASPMTTEQDALLHQRRVSLAAQRDALNEKWAGPLATAQERAAEARTNESKEAQILATYQSRLDEINTEYTALEARRIPMARNDQVRRIAGRFFGHKPEDVTDDQAGLVANIWFGSLAALAALAGPVTAIVALSLQRISSNSEKKAESKLSRLIRRRITKRRWTRIKTVSVPVPFEVAVEKIVEKRVEVPIETVIKEILYVPLLTDDPELVQAALKANLPREVSDLLIATTVPKGRSRASKAQHVPT